MYSGYVKFNSTASLIYSPSLNLMLLPLESVWQILLATSNFLEKTGATLNIIQSVDFLKLQYLARQIHKLSVRKADSIGLGCYY